MSDDYDPDVDMMRAYWVATAAKYLNRPLTDEEHTKAARGWHPIEGDEDGRL